MKPAPFRYACPRSLDHALALKGEHGAEARFLAGGQSLIPAMNFRLAQPAILIDLNGLTDLDYLRAEGSGMRIGALTRYRAAEHSPQVRRDQPLLAEVLPHIAHPQIRNRGTLCGNLAHADPASELPAVMLALGARLHAHSTRGKRVIDAADFFINLFETALREDEMLVEIELPPLPARSGTCFLELARRQGDYAMMGVAASVTLDEADRCVQARLALCNAGPTPMRAPKAAQMLVGHVLSADGVAAAADQARREIDPTGNVHCTAAYQSHLAGVLSRRALHAAGERAMQGVHA